MRLPAPVVLALLLAFALLAGGAAAAPVLSASASPLNPWLGQSVTLSMTCTDALGLKDAYADVTGPGILLPRQQFAMTGSDGTLSLDLSYLDRPGLYSAAVSCVNSADEVASTTVDFTVSELTAELTGLPAALYAGDLAEAYFMLKKDGTPVMSGVTFSVTVGGSAVTVQPPAFDFAKGWRLRFTVPAGSGSHKIVATASYASTTVSKESTATLAPVLSARVVTQDKSWVQAGEAVTFTIEALRRGQRIDLNAATVSAAIGGGAAVVQRVEPSGALWLVALAVPSGSGAQPVVVTVTDAGESIAATGQITYAKTVKGRLLDLDQKPVLLNLLFRNGGVEKKLSTQSDGSYEALLPTGSYEFTVDHPHALLTFSGVAADGFSDPLRFSEVSSELPGLVTAGAYLIEFAMPFSSAELQLWYDERKAKDEAALRVYACESWSAASGCGSGWNELDASIDEVRNRATVRVDDFSAFAIAAPRQLKIEAGIDPATAGSGDRVRVSGLVTDGSAPIGAAAVRVGSARVLTDAAGVFSVELTAPRQEGPVTLPLAASKEPFLDAAASIAYTVSNRRSLALAGPQLVRVEEGAEVSVELTLTNTGQVPVRGIALSAASSLVELGLSTVAQLEPGKSVTVPLLVRALEGAEKGTSSALVSAAGTEAQTEAVVGITVLPEVQPKLAEPAATAAAPVTGQFVLGEPLQLLGGFAGLSFLAAYGLRRRRLRAKPVVRPEVMGFLAEVRSEMERPQRKRRR